jgi:ERCC4-type nuclease
MNKELSYPALKSLGELAEARPCLIQDTREQIGLPFQRLACVRQMMPEGDYGILGVTDFAVELKQTLDELASNCVGHNRDRLEREFSRLRPYRLKRLLVIGASCEEDILTHIYRSRINPRVILASLFTWQSRFDLPYILVSSREKAARLIETLAFYHCREVIQSANGLLRSHWRSAKARIPFEGCVDAPEEVPEPPESLLNEISNQHT